jgi:molecular chaperone Hsp33
MCGADGNTANPSNAWPDMTDQIKKYLFPDHSTRVQAVRLTDAWASGLTHQTCPESVVPLLGELVAAAVLLASNIKFNGSLVLQLQGNGPIALMVAECRADLSIRATATMREHRTVPDEVSLQTLFNADGGGRLSVILDPDDRKKESGMQPYQGVVPLEGRSIAEVLGLYMKRSEQLDTQLWLAADATRSVGLLIQRLPHEGGQEAAEPDDDGWQRACHLASTLQHDELLALDTDMMIHRLFWQESLLTYEPGVVRWHCPCSRERVANMLRMLGRDEIDSILAERGHIDISCNFCGKPYTFDAIDCARLFFEPVDTPRTGADSVH